MGSTESQRLRGLDALRGVAIILVLLFHFTAAYPEVVAPHTQPLLFTLPHGNLGVQLFFMISGFVILMTLEKSKGISEFAVHRFARLYPCYLACASLTWVLCFPMGFNPLDLGMLPSLLNVFIGLSFPLAWPMLDPSYWTLSVEIIFYAAAAILFCTLGIRRIEIPCLVWLAIGIAGRDLHLIAHHWQLAVLLNVLHGYCFVAGMMIYRITSGRRSALTLATLACALCVPAVPFKADAEHAILLAAILIFAAGVWGTAAGKLRFLEWRPLLFIGNISYPLYLLHQVVGYFFIWRFEQAGMNANLAIPTAALAVVLLASLAHRAVELPAQRAIRAAYAREIARDARRAAVRAAAVS